VSVVRALAVLLVALLAGAAVASVVERLSAPELLDRSRVVCLFDVTHVRSRWAGARILTDVVGRCDRPVTGAAAGETVEWYVEGGVVDDVGMRVPGEPSFRPGDRAIVFLSEAAFGLRVTGMSQGAVFVRGEVALPAGAGAILARPAPDGLRARRSWHDAARPVADVLSDLRELARAR
jgi:hypothetical protein